MKGPPLSKSDREANHMLALAKLHLQQLQWQQDSKRLDFILAMAKRHDQFWTLVTRVSKIDPAFDIELLFATREDIDELMEDTP